MSTSRLLCVGDIEHPGDPEPDELIAECLRRFDPDILSELFDRTDITPHRQSPAAWSVPLLPDLIARIEEYLNAHNAKGTTFIWTATTDQILAKVARGRVALDRQSIMGGDRVLRYCKKDRLFSQDGRSKGMRPLTADPPRLDQRPGFGSPTKGIR